MKKIILVLSILLLCGCSDNDLIVPDYYEYIDLNGEKGIADVCFSPYGNMICELKDGTQIQVQSYRGIEYER